MMGQRERCVCVLCVYLHAGTWESTVSSEPVDHPLSSRRACRERGSSTCECRSFATACGGRSFAPACGSRSSASGAGRYGQRRAA